MSTLQRSVRRSTPSIVEQEDGIVFSSVGHWTSTGEWPVVFSHLPDLNAFVGFNTGVGFVPLSDSIVTSLRLGTVIARGVGTVVNENYRLSTIIEQQRLEIAALRGMLDVQRALPAEDEAPETLTLETAREVVMTIASRSFGPGVDFHVDVTREADGTTRADVKFPNGSGNRRAARHLIRVVAEDQPELLKAGLVLVPSPQD